MATETGTATGFLDLFDKVKSFILNPSQGDWELLPDYPEISSSTGLTHLRTSDDSAWKLFDARNEQYDTYSNNTYYQFQLTEEITLKAIRLSMPSLSGGGTILQSPASIELQESDDGVTWRSLKVWSGITTWSDLEMRQFDLDALHTGRRFRFYFRASNYGSSSTASTLILIKSDDTVHYVYANSTSVNRVLPKRILFRSKYSTSGIYAHMAMATIMNSDSKIYSLGFSGGADVSYSIQEGNNLPYPSYLSGSSYTWAYLWDSPMEYWLYGDHRQVYGAVRVGSTIQSFGFGYHLAYATPQQYPLPMFVGASNSDATYTWETDTRGDIKSFTNPGNGSLYVFSPFNTWQEVQNYDHYNGERLNPNDVCLWPGNLAAYNNQRNAPGSSDTNGNFILYPLVIKHTSNSIYGELKNIYKVPALNLTSGDTILIDGKTYRVFQDCWRTSQQDYFAILEE